MLVVDATILTCYRVLLAFAVELFSRPLRLVVLALCPSGNGYWEREVYQLETTTRTVLKYFCLHLMLFPFLG